jgi:hypothetical protein
MQGRPRYMTPYVNGNHPIAAVYQCCYNDTGYKKCQGGGGYPASFDLLKYEQQDLTMSCYLETFANNPNQQPDQVMASCQSQWGKNGQLPSGAAQKHQMCIQAKLDNYDCTRACCTGADADAWCTAHGDDPCVYGGDKDACGTPQNFCKDRLKYCPVVP